jgi:hypothetical protein
MTVFLFLGHLLTSLESNDCSPSTHPPWDVSSTADTSLNTPSDLIWRQASSDASRT